MSTYNYYCFASYLYKYLNIFITELFIMEYFYIFNGTSTVYTPLVYDIRVVKDKGELLLFFMIVEFFLEPAQTCPFFTILPDDFYQKSPTRKNKQKRLQVLSQLNQTQLFLPCWCSWFGLVWKLSIEAWCEPNNQKKSSWKRVFSISTRTLERFLCGVKPNKSTTGFHDSRYAILLWFQKLKY